MVLCDSDTALAEMTKMVAVILVWSEGMHLSAIIHYLTNFRAI